METEREMAISVWSMMWPESLHVEHQFDPAYIAQREAFIDGFILGRKSKEAP
jgi:hypothetical protein